MNTQAMTIRFEDHGQDFLEWDIDADGVVVESRPFQTAIWGGAKIMYPKSLKAGDFVHFTRGSTVSNIRYPVVKVTRHKRKAA